MDIFCGFLTVWSLFAVMRVILFLRVIFFLWKLTILLQVTSAKNITFTPWMLVAWFQNEARSISCHVTWPLPVMWSGHFLSCDLATSCHVIWLPPARYRMLCLLLSRVAAHRVIMSVIDCKERCKKMWRTFLIFTQRRPANCCTLYICNFVVWVQLVFFKLPLLNPPCYFWILLSWLIFSVTSEMLHTYSETFLLQFASIFSMCQ